MPGIPALGRWRQGSQEFKARLTYIVSSNQIPCRENIKGISLIFVGVAPVGDLFME